MANFFFDRVMPVIAVLFFGLMAFLLLVWLPVSLVAEKTCLEAGYPKASVTYDLSVYCSNLDGNVTVKVDKQ